MPGFAWHGSIAPEAPLSLVDGHELEFAEEVSLCSIGAFLSPSDAPSSVSINQLLSKEMVQIFQSYPRQ